ncbi:MAG: fasciclin domain-containing protein [Acidimicrobiia bacterium]|nr:fasciclin domain-containing protein [Acidimicrobiia bacterium]
MKFRMTALVALSALVVAACSADEEATTTTSTPTETETETTEAPMTENTIVDVAVDAGFSTLVTAVQAAGLVETLESDGPFTVFAPTDDAFAALPEGVLDGLLADTEALSAVLTYHVVSGEVLAADVVGLNSATSVQGEDIAITVDDGGVVLNGLSNVVTTDVEASNGVIHVIDAVILPPSLSADEPMASDQEPMMADIIATATEAGSFTTLLAAVEAAGLTETLQGEGPFTVFAPTDEAFAALGEETINGLLEDTETLSQILLYHVVSGEVLAASVVELEAATTVQGEDISIAIVDGGVVLNGTSNVVTTDILTSNGVIHVIDAVILPPAAS